MVIQYIKESDSLVIFEKNILDKEGEDGDELPFINIQD